MTTFQVFCESCGSDHDVHFLDKKKPKFCSVCGSELDDSSIGESDASDDFDEEDWGWDEEDK